MRIICSSETQSVLCMWNVVLFMNSIPPECHRIRDPVQVIDDPAVADCLLTLKFFITSQTESRVIPETEITIANFQDSDVSSSAGGQVAEFFALRAKAPGKETKEWHLPL